MSGDSLRLVEAITDLVSLVEGWAAETRSPYCEMRVATADEWERFIVMDGKVHGLAVKLGLQGNVAFRVPKLTEGSSYVPKGNTGLVGRYLFGNERFPMFGIPNWRGRLESLKAATVAIGTTQDRAMSEAVAVVNGPSELFAKIEGAVLDSNAGEILRTLGDETIGREDRARRVCRIDHRYWSKPASFWAEFLRCSDAAVRQWKFWTVERKNYVGGK